MREDFGYPPLVTPSSQIVGTQAVLNIITGERYKMVPKESKAMLRGEYGKLPGTVNEEVRAKAGIKPEDVITCRPADLLEPELPKYREEYKDLAKSEEDVLSLALFPQVAPKFINRRNLRTPKPHRTMAPIAHREARSAPSRPSPASKTQRKSPFHLEGRFSYFVRSSCICTCGMPSSKNSSDVW